MGAAFFRAAVAWLLERASERDMKAERVYAEITGAPENCFDGPNYKPRLTNTLDPKLRGC